MSIFSRLFGSKQQRSTDIRDPRFWMNQTGGGGFTSSGNYITPDNSMKISTVFACVSLLSALIASLPLQLYKWRKDGRGQDPAEDHPLYEKLYISPNGEQSSYEFREMLQYHLCLRGNSFAYKEVDGYGRVTNLIPLFPSKMTVQREGYDLWYYYSVDPSSDQEGMKPTIYRYPSDWIWHMKLVSVDGILGLSPISMARESIGMAQGMENFGAEWFGKKPLPGMILKTKKQLSPKAKENLRESVNAFATDRRYMAMLLEEDMEIVPTEGMTNADSQYIENRSWQVEDICRFFNVPPYLVHHQRDKASTFASAEQLTLNFVIFSLVAPWIARWEASMAKNLLTDRERSKYFFKFNVNALLRGDYKSRMQGYALGRQWGIFSPNDIRGLEDMNPREGGDKYIDDPKNITGNQPGNQAKQPVQPTNGQQQGSTPQPVKEGNTNALD